MITKIVPASLRGRASLELESQGVRWTLVVARNDPSQGRIGHPVQRAHGRRRRDRGFGTPASSASKALSRSGRIRPTAPVARPTGSSKNEERKRAGGEARGGLGKRAVTELERKHLAEVDRQIAECEAYIAQQRELTERAIQKGRSTEVAEETLDALQASLRAFEKQRRWLLDRLKSASDDHHR
jgi:hypothetical protein